MRIINLIALSALLIVPALARAADASSSAPAPATTPAAAPSADTVRQVMSYYHDGSNVILVEAKLCKDIGKQGENKNECVDEISDGKVQKGDKAYVWLNFLVPGDNAPAKTVLVQFSYKGMVLHSKQLRMNQSIRYRTWYLLPTSQEGEWNVTASQEEAKSFQKLGGLSYTVEAAVPAVAPTPPATGAAK